jgi:hypothetical protein
VYVGGLLQPRSGGTHAGADAPQPSSLVVPGPGISADVHLASVLNSVVEGLYRRGEVQKAHNVMIETKDVPPGTPLKEALPVTPNVDFATYANAVDEARKVNKLNVTALRFFRPAQAPEFGVDAHGFLVVMVHDIELEIPAPDKSTRVGSMLGVPARILRLIVPHAEITLSYQTEAKGPGSQRIKARIEDFSPSPACQVLAVNEDEKKPTPLTRFSTALVISAAVARLRTLAIEADLDRLVERLRSLAIEADLDLLKVRGFAIQSITPIDPTGWLRVTIARVPEQGDEGVWPKVETPPTPGPRTGPVSTAPAPATSEPVYPVAAAPR